MFRRSSQVTVTSRPVRPDHLFSTDASDQRRALLTDNEACCEQRPDMPPGRFIMTRAQTRAMMVDRDQPKPGINERPGSSSHTQRPLPAETISLILSFLPPRSLTTAACVSRLFQLESEFHLYRSVSITSYIQSVHYTSATINSARRRARLVSLRCEAGFRCAITLPYLLTGGSFPNLRHLSYPCFRDFNLTDPLQETPGSTISSTRPSSPPSALTSSLSSHTRPRLRSLECEPDLDESFLAFLATQPTISHLNIVLQTATALPGTHVVPALEELTCPERELALFISGRPLRRVALLGPISAALILNSVLPTLTSASCPTPRSHSANINSQLTCLSLILFSTNSRLFAATATSLPALQMLVVHDSMNVDDDEEQDESIREEESATSMNPSKLNPTSTDIDDLMTESWVIAQSFSLPRSRHRNAQKDIRAAAMKTLFAPLALLSHLSRFMYAYGHDLIQFAPPECVVDEVFSWATEKSVLREIKFAGGCFVRIGDREVARQWKRGSNTFIEEEPGEFGWPIH